MQISILSYYSGVNNRGVESWASSLFEHTNQFKIVVLSGFDSYNPFKWLGSDVVVPTNGRLQVVLARIFNKKIVVFGHSGPGADDKWNLWCSPNVFVAFSTPQAKWANKFKLPWTKVIVIPHAVDTKIFAPDKKIKKSVDVLCVAANRPDKRVDQVVAASEGLAIRVVGSGQLEQVSFEQMPEVYNLSRIFCFVPKSHEAFGLVYIEAMACNLPVVAPNDPVRTEIVGDAGILVGDMNLLPQAIKTALETKWGDRPRQQALKFSWDKIINLYTKLWLSL